MRGSILGIERRRRWSDEAKLAVVHSVGVDGATVTQVAERHEITRQQIYGWRRDLKRKGLLAATANVRFVALDVVDPPRLPPETEVAVDANADADPVARPWPVELLLRHGRSLRFDGAGAVDVAALARLIRAVEAA